MWLILSLASSLLSPLYFSMPSSSVLTSSRCSQGEGTLPGPSFTSLPPRHSFYPSLHSGIWWLPSCFCISIPHHFLFSSPIFFHIAPLVSLQKTPLAVRQPASSLALPSSVHWESWELFTIVLVLRSHCWGSKNTVDICSVYCNTINILYWAWIWQLGGYLAIYLYK